MDTDAPITTDHEHYLPGVFGDQVSYTITATYINTTEESVYLVPCGFELAVYALERFDGESWQRSSFGHPCTAVLAPSVEVEPEETPNHSPPYNLMPTALLTLSYDSAPT